MEANTVFISGATSGIGKATALLMAEKGYRILAHGRDPIKLDALHMELNAGSQGIEHKMYQADLTSHQEIQDVSAQIKRENDSLYGIISNAGIFSHEKRLVSEKQVEETFMVNQLAAFMLIKGLLGLLKMSEGEKHILQVSSMTHASSIDLKQVNNPTPYDGYRAYSESKLCNILMIKYLAPRLAGDQILVNSLHPGVINTRLLHEGWGSIGGPVSDSAKIILQSFKMQLPENSGAYFMNARPVPPAPVAEDPALQEAHWQLNGFLSGFL
ncbi:MAG: SDR family NAD(P)-dependent oxidoreductase [Bacteroidota bacterium]